MKLPIGIDNFKKLIQDNYQHIDKSLFIREILDDGSETLLITRPRRFGKTLNMSMLYYFFDCQEAQHNRALFEHTKIATAKTQTGQSCMDFQGQYPVIFLTLKSIKAPHYEAALQAIAKLISDLFKAHRYLLDSTMLYEEEKNLCLQFIQETADVSALQNSLKKLSEYLSRYYDKKVIILMDEYDAPMHASYTAENPYHRELLDFMKVFLGEAFKGNAYLEKGVLTGILRVSLMNLFSGVNNIPVHSVLQSEYEEWFGFTDEEVQQFFELASFPYQLDEIRKWYNGYQIGEVTLYNPWSIISCLYRKGKLQPYWLETGEEGVLGKTLKNSGPDVKAQLERLIQGESIESFIDERTIFTDLQRNPDAIWGLLVYSGYLKVIDSRMIDFELLYRLAIPNQEIMGTYKSIVTHWFTSVIDRSTYEQLYNSLSLGHLDQFQELLQEYLDESVSYYDFTKKTLEQFYHVFILGMLLVLRDRFEIKSNQESGYGRYDLALFPKGNNLPGILMEFKLAKDPAELKQTAQIALQQIDQKRYDAHLKKRKVPKIFHIGIAFCGKLLAMEYLQK